MAAVSIQGHARRLRHFSLVDGNLSRAEGEAGTCCSLGYKHGICTDPRILTSLRYYITLSSLRLRRGFHWCTSPVRSDTVQQNP